MTKNTSKTMTPEQKREAHNAAIRERWATDPEFRARRKASFKKWRQGKGYEKFTAYQRKYHEEHSGNKTAKVIQEPSAARAAYNARRRERYATDPDYKARVLESIRKYQAKHAVVKTHRKTRPCLIAGVAMTDLARAAGVSTMTVCRLVNKPELLTRKMRIKVLSGLVQYKG